MFLEILIQFVVLTIGSAAFMFLFVMSFSEYKEWDDARKKRWREMSGGGGGIFVPTPRKEPMAHNEW